MYIDTKHDGKWHISKDRTIYTSRPGKLDVRVRYQTNWGYRLSDGQFYATAVCFAAEDGSILSIEKRLPPEITPALLKQWGFLD